jgi:hypothetical protein
MTTSSQKLQCEDILNIVNIMGIDAVICKKVLERYIADNRIYQSPRSITLDFIKVDTEFNYHYYVGDLINTPEFKQLLENIIVKNKLNKLLELIIGLDITKHVEITPLCCPYSKFKDSLSENKTANEIASDITDFIGNDFDNTFKLLQFLLAYYIANLSIVNDINNANKQLIESGNKISFIHLNLGILTSHTVQNERIGGHACALIFEKIQDNTVCEFYDPNGISPLYDLPLLLPILKKTFGDRIEFINFAKKPKMWSGIQNASYWKAKSQNDPHHIADLCMLYCAYYISRRLRNPGRAEDTYLRFLGYYDRHSQIDLLNWCCRRLHECITNKHTNLYQELQNKSRSEQYHILQEYLSNNNALKTIIDISRAGL